ncbi:MAG: AraC family transcriptional regulator [Oscillospiraceae bacterium]
MKRLTTFQKTFLSYLVICTIPVAILATALFFTTSNYIKKEQEARRVYESEIIGRTLDGEFSRLQRLGLQLKDTSWVKKRGSATPVFESEFTFDSKRSICADLRGYVAALGFARSVSVVFPGQNEVYSSVGYYSAEDFFRSFSIGRGRETLYPEAVYERVKLLKAAGLVLGSELGMTQPEGEKLFYVEALEYGQPLRCFLMIEVNASSIKNTLSSLKSDELVSFAIQKGKETVFRTVFAPQAATMEQSYQSSSFPMRFLASYLPRPYAGRSRLLLLWLIVLTAVLLVLNLAWLLSRRSYRPLLHLVEQMGGGKTMLQQGGNEYQFLEASITSLNEERENVLQQARRYRETARANFLRRLLQGYFSSSGAAEKLQEFDVSFSEKLYHVVFLVDLRGGESGLMPLEEALSSLDAVYESIEVGKGRIAAILGMTKEQKRGFNTSDFATRIQLSYEENTELQPIVYSGSVEPGLLGIGKSYYIASELLAAQGVSKHVALYKNCYYPTEWELQLINRAKAGQQKLVTDILNEIRVENEKRGVVGTQMRQLISLVAETYSKIINEFDQNPARYAELYTVLNEQADNETLWSALYAVNELFCEEKNAHGDSEDAQQQIFDYVKENLTNPNLSLKELSDRFNLSVSAVSKMFKRICGINFYDYLLSGRMELAAEMLENKHLSMPLIARAVGYENEYSFKRAFARFYGASTTEFLKTKSRKSGSKYKGETL